MIAMEEELVLAAFAFVKSYGLDLLAIQVTDLLFGF